MSNAAAAPARASQYAATRATPGAQTLPGTSTTSCSLAAAAATKPDRCPASATELEW